MTDRDQPERRKNPRIGSKDTDQPVTTVHYFLLSDPRRNLSSAPVLDMSTEGLSLLTQHEITPGTSVQLLIEPARPKVVDVPATVGGAYRVIAVVRWSDKVKTGGGHLVGLAFLPVSIAEARNRKGLERIMNSYEIDS